MSGCVVTLSSLYEHRPDKIVRSQICTSLIKWKEMRKRIPYDVRLAYGAHTQLTFVHVLRCHPDVYRNCGSFSILSILVLTYEYCNTVQSVSSSSVFLTVNSTV
jgi:hypothetical protein